MLNYNFSRKGSGASFSTTFCIWFFNKNVSHVTFFWLTKFHCLIAFTSRDIRQYVYWLFVNQAVTSQNLKLTLSFWTNRFATWPRSQDKNLSILRTKRAFEMKWKAFFIIFKGFSVAKNCPRFKSAPLNLAVQFWLNEAIQESVPVTVVFM